MNIEVVYCLFGNYLIECVGMKQVGLGFIRGLPRYPYFRQIVRPSFSRFICIGFHAILDIAHHLTLADVQQNVVLETDIHK